MREPHEVADLAGLGLQQIAVLIPAWQPGPSLLTLVAELRSLPFAVVLVVDDGSAPPSQPVFQALRDAGVPVLRHAVNLGKGRALKTGFNALLADYSNVLGVVTADADGQHTPEDIARVAEMLAVHQNRAVLGTRGFVGKVPLRSRLGNTLTRAIFGFVTGARMQDTQSGLRGLPMTVLPELLLLEGERYEYEMSMLAHLCRSGLRPLEVPIQTVYIEGNRDSHFHPIWDSMRICFVLARFYKRTAQIVWALAASCLLVQLAALHTGWLNAFFFDTTAPNTRGIDFFPLVRGFSNLIDGRSIFDTFHSEYGPYATWFLYHPAMAFVAAPWLLFAPWTAYALWTAFSAALMILCVVLLARQGSDPLRRALVGLLLLGSFPGFLVLYSGNAQAIVVLSVVLVLVAVDRMCQHAANSRMYADAQITRRMLLIGLLLSLFSKPLVLAMLPLLLLLRETRRTALRAVMVYVAVSMLFLVVPGLNPVAMPWSQRWFLLTHPAIVAATMNPYTNGFNITSFMQDNSTHWLAMLGLNSYRMFHLDVYSLPVLLDRWLGTQTPDALYRVPLIFVLAITILVALMRSAEERLEAALFTLMAAAVVVLVSYSMIWEYHFTLVLPVAGFLLLRSRKGWLERCVVALGWLAWAPSLYVLLRGQDILAPSVMSMLHAERVLPALAIFCLLLFRAAQLALRSSAGFRHWGRDKRAQRTHPASA